MTTGPIRDLDAEIEAAREELIALCATLVAVDSINPPGPTRGVADVVAGWLKGRGAPAEIVAADPDVPNVVSDVRGGRPGRHVVFNAHMDTMPPGDERLWSVPPFDLTRKNGRLYGLGMGNMKGALAAMALVTALIHRRAAALPGRLSLTAVSDEVMFGECGTVFLLGERPELKGDFLVSGEGPGYMGLAVAEKGLLWLDVEAVGHGGHSSGARRGGTAAIALATFLVEVDRLNDRFATCPPELPGVSGGDGNLGFRLSVNVGAMQAGGVRSQIATSAQAALDIRLPPGFPVDEVERLVRACVPPGADIRITRVKGWNANWTGVADPLSQAVHQAACALRVGEQPFVVRLPGSDARRWRELGVPAICYGPQPELYAGIDDHVIEQDLVDCAKVYARTALALMAAD